MHECFLSLTKSSKLSILFWNFFHLIVYSECHSVFVEIFLIFKPFIVLCCGSSEFKHSPVFGYLGCFQYFAISDNAAAKSLVQIFFFLYYWISSEKMEGFNFSIVWAILCKWFYNVSSYLSAWSYLHIYGDLTNVFKAVEVKYFIVIIFLPWKPWHQSTRSGLGNIFSLHPCSSQSVDFSFPFTYLSVLFDCLSAQPQLFLVVFSFNLICVRFLHVILLTGCSLRL